MDPIAHKIAARYMANVIPFKPKTKGPTIDIGGHHYVLSTDGGPLGDETDPDASQGGMGHARIIKGPPRENKWRFLWAYDTQKQEIGMWRVSDGNEKHFGSAHSEQSRIVKLEKKGELNRVTSAQMGAIIAEMRKREDRLLKDLRESVELNKTTFDRQMGGLAQEFYKLHVKAHLEKAVSDVNKGATPLGFKPHGPDDEDGRARHRQMIAFVLGSVMRREMGKDKFEAFVRHKGFNPDEDLQAVHWAVDEVYEEVLEKYLPPR